METSAMAKQGTGSSSKFTTKTILLKTEKLLSDIHLNSEIVDAVMETLHNFNLSILLTEMFGLK